MSNCFFQHIIEKKSSPSRRPKSLSPSLYTYRKPICRRCSAPADKVDTESQ